MNKAVFLDRDGVINRKAPEGHYVTRWEEMYFIPGVARAIGLLNRAGYDVIVVTNQRCVAKGLVTAADMDSMHRQMCDELMREGAKVEAVYYCPHENHPPCGCRKPAPGMLLEAARTHKIDLNASWMIGDSEIDVEAGRKAGCKTVRLLSTTKAVASGADVVAASLLEAIHRILEHEERQTGGNGSQPHRDREAAVPGSSRSVQTRRNKPHERSYGRIVEVLCVSILCILLTASLWPFHAPKNEVDWLSNDNGLHFGRYSSIMSSGMFGGDAIQQDGGSVEIWLAPNRVDDRSTILAFDGSGDGTVPFLLQQCDRDLLIRRQVVDAQGVSRTALLKVGSVFREKERKFLTITLGRQNASVYVDGILTEVSPILGSASNSLTGQLIVANSPIRHDSWSGQILGLAVYHRELTSTEVEQQYQAWMRNQRPTFPENEAQVALYLFKEHAGDTVHNEVDPTNGLIIPRDYFVLHSPFLVPPWRADDFDWGRVRDIIVSVAGFVPFGFAMVAYLPSARRRNRPAVTTLVSGFLLSVTIETLQASLPTRDSDMTDIIANTLGTGVGVMFYQWSVIRALLPWGGRFGPSFVEDHSRGELIGNAKVGSGVPSRPNVSPALSPKGGADLNERTPLHVGPGVLAVKATEVSGEALSRAVRDRYRCPQEFLDFALSGQLSSDHGFFRFGQNAICYGRSCLGSRERLASSSLYDTLEHVLPGEAKLKLPFDPTEIIDNLRLEQYVDRSEKTSFRSVLRKLYYLFRPLTNLSLRRRIQKFHARHWRKSSFPEWPVDTTVENICETLLSLSLKGMGLERVPFVWFWPKGARGCLMMTHDVETTAGRDFCTELMDIDESFGINASFQVVPEDRYKVAPEFLDAIRDRGFEVVVHDLNHDGRLFGTREEFLRRAAIINRYATEYRAKGFRAAVLYRNPEWYGSLDFSFDMSFPNVAHLDPQAGGCCTVMPYFIGDTLEVPVTTTQDYTLFHLLNERSIDLWKAQIERILQKNGLVSFIVHPDYVMEDDTKSVYKALLAYLRDVREKQGIWCALPSDVDRWWRARSRMSIVNDGNSWRIEGEGAENAVLAYAKNVNGKLIYELAGTDATG